MSGRSWRGRRRSERCCCVLRRSLRSVPPPMKLGPPTPRQSRVAPRRCSLSPRGRNGVCVRLRRAIERAGGEGGPFRGLETYDSELVKSPLIRNLRRARKFRAPLRARQGEATILDWRCNERIRGLPQARRARNSIPANGMNVTARMTTAPMPRPSPPPSAPAHSRP
jgi:hypothetical protein